MIRTRRETLDMERTLPPETLAEWKREYAAWEEDTTNPNPFRRKHELVSLASVRFELAAEGGGMVRGDTASSEMLAMGLKLEGEQ